MGSLKGRSHKAAGISKRVSEAVFPADILSDAEYNLCSDIGRGAWSQTLWQIWHNKSDRLEKPFSSLVILWNASPSRARQAIHELILHGPCNVKIDGKAMSRDDANCPIGADSIVTLINRRKQRQENYREQGRLRKRAQREREVSQQCHSSGHTRKTGSSVSSSLSLSEESIASSLTDTEQSRIIDHPFEILTACVPLRNLKADQYRAVLLGRHRLMDFEAAARETVKAVNVNGGVNKPGPYVNKCFENFEKNHREEILACVRKHDERKTDLTDMVKFVDECGLDSERVTRAKTDFTRKWGKMFWQEVESSITEQCT